MNAAPFPRTRRVRRRPLVIAGFTLVGLLILLGASSTFFTELLWFQETGYEKVFWAGVWVRAGLGAAFGAAFALLLLVNLWIVRKITDPARLFTVPDQILERYRATLQPYMRWAVIGGAVLFGLFAGSGATVVWNEWLLFRNAVEFGQTDPVFGKDIGFFVFRLPFQRFVFTWLFSTLVVVTLVTGFAHYFMGGIRPQARGDRVSPEVRAHLSVLLGLIVLLKAWGYRLDQFALLYSPRGTVTGASYTDVNAQLPALKLLVVIAIVVSIFFFLNARLRNWVLPIAGIGLLALTSILAGGAYPAAVQRLRVTPNELAREREYIQRNMEATQVAYGIDDVEMDSDFPAEPSLTFEEVQDNRSTVENIRLWEPKVLQNAYLQLQRIKQYYEFLDVDVDRYTFANGERRQVMLSPREIATDKLDPGARTWVNQHLVYTHGYGVVASRVDRVTAEGRPSFIVRSIPTQSVEGAPVVDQPRIYFGENSELPYVVVNTTQRELDFPQADTFATTTYGGDGGIRLNGIVRRAAFAWRFRDVNLLISGTIKPESKILFRRQVMERVQAVAPFLRLDRDPYITVVDGRLVWMVDAYTTTDMYPYSQRSDLASPQVADRTITPAGSINYIRNSVKFAIDAEHGSIKAYLWDEEDPIIRAWAKAFPGIFLPRDEMPDSLLEHVRYPEGLFRVQTQRFGSYHIEDPDNFYSKEDAWVVANDPTAEGLQAPQMPPYYVLMRLPDEKELSFVLVRPFTPNGRQNLTAYMVAHGDPDKYGRLVSYVFPKTDAIFGPEQVQARINQEPAVAQQITLWDQAGSTVIRGNLLTIPVADSLLYVQPLYLQGEGSQFPELKRVVAVSGETVRMGDTLNQALAAIFGRAEPSEIEGPDQPEGPSATVTELLAEALEHDRRAQAALREGDWATYGREQELMRRALERAAEQAGASPTASPSPAAG